MTEGNAGRRVGTRCISCQRGEGLNAIPGQVPTKWARQPCRRWQAIPNRLWRGGRVSFRLPIAGEALSTFQPLAFRRRYAVKPLFAVLAVALLAADDAKTDRDKLQ